jgi:hypothetical protein
VRKGKVELSDRGKPDQSIVLSVKRLFESSIRRSRVSAMIPMTDSRHCSSLSRLKNISLLVTERASLM